ncbi:uncharacterized protein UMAG_06163 [Mycosarcoma maydis]|uniref:DUF1742-domain-containing protein n=1 Tax=Mycosarcoma maydis TaxID=5270 RepID=A0A0D1CFH0_MYCMD|nr:uncharacterized protein UMAG_06163 [Ustilago maydis 521]KIS65783.1 hypothetical protein UMAG_06163 [Ustilago maydis 521]|eukprot:XP_011392540.1 hypothetical protein UMAG_06163 [Ustilago maydis 521]
MAAVEGKPSNVYIHRQAGTPKSCFVCYKSSPHVLVSQSIPTLDFLYVCHAHLADRHFATKLCDPASAPGSTTAERLPDKVSQDEIAKIKAEYEAKQKAKESAKAKEEDANKESKPLSAMGMAGSVFSTVTSTVSGLASSAISSIPAEAAASTAATASNAAAAETLAKQHPLHAKYALHREFYAARVRDWNHKMVKKKEKELNMPPAPRNALS